MSGKLIDRQGRTFEPTKPPEAPAPRRSSGFPTRLEFERALLSELEAQGVFVVSESSDVVGHRLKVDEGLRRFYDWLEREAVPEPVEG